MPTSPAIVDPIVDLQKSLTIARREQTRLGRLNDNYEAYQAARIRVARLQLDLAMVLVADKPVTGYRYGTAPDGLPYHSRSEPVTFTLDQVVRWHTSKGMGDARTYLGANLANGAFLYIVRSEQSPGIAAALEIICRARRALATNESVTGSSRTIVFSFFTLT